MVDEHTELLDERTDLLDDARHCLGKWTLDQLKAFRSCLGHTKRGEPFFVLRAQDKLATTIVREWARLAEENKVENDKVGDALMQAAEMDYWGREHGVKMPD